MSARLTSREVCSPRIHLAKITVKNGAEALMVSVKDAACEDRSG